MEFLLGKEKDEEDEGEEEEQQEQEQDQEEEEEEEEERKEGEEGGGGDKEKGKEEVEGEREEEDDDDDDNDDDDDDDDDDELPYWSGDETSALNVGDPGSTLDQFIPTTLTLAVMPEARSPLGLVGPPSGWDSESDLHLLSHHGLPPRWPSG